MESLKAMAMDPRYKQEMVAGNLGEYIADGKQSSLVSDQIAYMEAIHSLYRCYEIAWGY
jgi:hypothetical protein